MTNAWANTAPPSITDLIPHRPPMAFVTDLVRADADGALARSVIGTDSLVAEPDGTVSPLALLEIIAQACAAYGGWRTLAFGRRASAVLLVGVRAFDAVGRSRVGVPMEVAVTLTREFGGFHLFEGVLRQDGREIARADIKAFHPPQEAGEAGQ